MERELGFPHFYTFFRLNFASNSTPGLRIVFRVGLSSVVFLPFRNACTPFGEDGGSLPVTLSFLLADLGHPARAAFPFPLPVFYISGPFDAFVPLSPGYFPPLFSLFGSLTFPLRAPSNSRTLPPGRARGSSFYFSFYFAPNSPNVFLWWVLPQAAAETFSLIFFVP